MKVGFDTVVFGLRFASPADMEWALDLIAKAGFVGVDIAQLPETLGKVEDLLRNRPPIISRSEFGYDISPSLQRDHQGGKDGHLHGGS